MISEITIYLLFLDIIQALGSPTEPFTVPGYFIPLLSSLVKGIHVVCVFCFSRWLITPTKWYTLFDWWSSVVIIKVFLFLSPMSMCEWKGFMNFVSYVVTWVSLYYWKYNHKLIDDTKSSGSTELFIPCIKYTRWCTCSLTSFFAWHHTVYRKA